MNQTNFDRHIPIYLARALLPLPVLLVIVFLMHFGGLDDFLNFRWNYTPHPANEIVPSLIKLANHWPLLHEPHMIAYLTLPLFLLVAFALYFIGRSVHPRAGLLALVVTMVGTIYLGGLFGMWTAFFRGIGNVDPSQADGAIATFSALTQPSGAFLLTTTLAKLVFVGLILQSAVLFRVRSVPMWSPIMAISGCALFLLFWDQDNWMLIGSLLMLAGFIPLGAVLRQLSSVGAMAHSSASQ